MVQHSLVIRFCIFAILFTGCSPTSAPDSSGQATPSPGANKAGSTSTASGSLKLTVFADLDEPEMQNFPEPDSTLIEKQVRALNWTNPKQRPIVHLTRVDAGGETTFVKVQGTMGTPNTDGTFRVIGYQLHGKNWAGEQPLESVDAAVEILLTFRNDPEKAKALSRDWKVDTGNQ